MFRKKIYAFFIVFLVTAVNSNVQAAIITIAPDTPNTGNCYPFGGDSVGWTNYVGFVYQNIPAFDINPGDTIAFDLGVPNDSAPQLDIEFTATTSNGSDVPSGVYTKLVSNTQSATTPLGNAVVGDYELEYTAEASFSFAGGGMIIRFSNPSAAYQLDTTCDQVLVNASTGDTSGFFVGRFFSDTDGLPPYSSSLDNGSIGAFRLITGNAPPAAAPIPTLSQWALYLLMGFLAVTGLIYTKKGRGYFVGS